MYYIFHQNKKKNIIFHRTLNLFDGTDRFPARPYILDDYPKNLTVLQNSTAEFSCPVIADIAAHITWAKYKAFNDTEDTMTPTTLRLEVHKRKPILHSIKYSSWFFFFFCWCKFFHMNFVTNFHF